MKRPSVYSPLKICLQVSALAAALLCCTFSSADPLTGLENGDFSSGFDHWQGEVFDGGYVDVDPLPGGYAANFDASSGSAVLTNDFFNFGITLFQEFTVQDLASPGNTLWLSLDFSASINDAFDFVVAELVDTAGGLLTLDLSSGGPIDITAWAGIAAEILFLVEDGIDPVTGGFGKTGDFLTIDNISITQRTAAVPEPTSLMLLLGAGLGLVASQRKRPS